MTTEQFKQVYENVLAAAKNNKIIKERLEEKCSVNVSGENIIVSFRIFRCTYCDIRELKKILEQLLPDREIIYDC